MTCLIHHGIKGQRWGIRRFQNKDRSLTSAYYKSVVKTSELYKKIENDPRFLTSFGRGTVSAVGSFKYRRSTYDADTGASPDEVTYDKTKVRVNTEKERKRNSKRRRERTGYGLNKYYYYFY